MSLLFAEECCSLRAERSRSDQIPHHHVAAVDDDYLTGYIQALIDMHYYEFQVRVIVVDKTAYLFDLPCNCLIAYSIFCFVSDVPCINCVRRVDCSCQEFLALLYEEDPASAATFASSTAYQSVCCMPCPGCRIRGIWMPQTTLLFAPLFADPRQPQNAVALRFNDNVVGKHVGAPSFGGDFIIFRWKDVFPWHGDMDFGVQAGIFAVFDLDHPEACMVNTDFFVAALVTYAYKCWSYRFRWWHMSSHLGDEFLLTHSDYPRCNVSDEGVDIFASFQLNPAPLALVTGGGPGAMEVGNRVARSLHILSCANIVDFRSDTINEQKQNPYVDAKMTYRLDQLIERQAEFYLDFPIFVMGGVGTDFEFCLENVRQKVGARPSSPILLFGPKKYWQDKITSIFKCNLENGTIQGSEWIGNTFFCVETAQQALAIYQEYFSGNLPIGPDGPIIPEGFVDRTKT